jgi:hypothetical protein
VSYCFLEFNEEKKLIEREWAKNMLGSESLERVVRKFILLSSAVACTSLLMLGPAGADDFGGRSAGLSVERGAIDSAFHAVAPHAALHTEIHAGHGNAMARDTLDLEASGGYTNEYVFGMTKAVMGSTLAPAVKPLALIFTIPLDLATLPFAVVGGFMR